ncbi:MAG TPA: serine/threonine-protein kinase, partial [Polyangiales bacterium]
DPFIGQRIDGRFKVELFLGAGSVGSVYRAKDLQTGGQVAIKIWSHAAHDEQTRGRFAREARALTTLRHPNIVAVQGYGAVDELPYVAMEFLDGEPLEACLKEGQPLPTGLAYDVITQILQALSYAHGLGVVHRDLKPDNVLLLAGAREQRVVKLLDFGLAKFLSPEDDPIQGATLTMHGMVMGTPLYMAPEQAAGRSVDARVDVYAAGCVLFEMLAGRPPFLGESNAEIFRAHMTAPVPNLSEIRTDVRVAPGLQEWFERALAKLPEDRFAHAGQMLEALLELPTAILRPPSMLPPVATEKARPSDRFRLLLAVITGLCTAAALAYALLY